MRKLFIGALAATLVVTGCANMSETERGTAIGAGVGAGLGAIIGGHNAGAGALIGGATGAVIGNVWSSRMENQKRQMEQATRGTGVAVSQTTDNRLKLEIPSDISFDTGRADIKPAFRPILDHFGASLNENQSTTVMIVGHTDNTGSDAINNPLSMERAAHTRDYLNSRGVAFNRINIDGRGDREPVASNANDSGRARNRRVEIYVAERQQ